MDDKTLTAKAEFLVKEARLDADAFRENTVYNADGDAIRLIANAERLEQYADTIEAQATRNEALEAALREVFIHGHSEGWRGNQMRRDVKHVDAEKSWSLYVSNGALEKTITRKALEGSGND